MARGCCAEASRSFWNRISAEIDRQFDISAIAVLIAIDGRLAGRFVLSDQLREGARAVISGLAAEQMDIRLISGDHQATVDRIAAEIGVSSAQGDDTGSETCVCH